MRYLHIYELPCVFLFDSGSQGIISYSTLTLWSLEKLLFNTFYIRVKTLIKCFVHAQHFSTYISMHTYLLRPNFYINTFPNYAKYLCTS